MSEEMTMLSGRGIRVDSSQPHDQEITVDNHRQHIDELLEVIKGANGMPVLVVTTSDGRLSAIAMNGLQNMVPTNGEVNDSTENKSKDFRAWLLLIASLAATATFTAGMTPPGGFWGEDKDHHTAGVPVMYDKFFMRYKCFIVSNSFAFFSSLSIIATLAMDIDKKRTTPIRAIVLPFFVSVCFLSLAASYISGTWDREFIGIFNIGIFASLLSYVAFSLFVVWV
ncbi:unnamed protein product [Alopecurus aequalis]